MIHNFSTDGQMTPYIDFVEKRLVCPFELEEGITAATRLNCLALLFQCRPECIEVVDEKECPFEPVLKVGRMGKCFEASGLGAVITFSVLASDPRRPAVRHQKN